MYREQWVADILGDRSILQVALDVHMTTTGSLERGKAAQELDVLALREVEDTWDNHHACDFDDVVLKLIQTAIKESGYETTSNTYQGESAKRYSVVTEDGKVVFSDCIKAEAEHFAASLPKHVNAKVVGEPLGCSRCLGVGYVRARQPGNAAVGVYKCPKCSDA